MKIFAITVLLVAIFSLPIICQTSLIGKIIDGETSEELIAANVTLYRGGVFITGAATDFDGNYSINLDPGSYDVEVSYIGYQTCRINRVVVRGNKINRFDLALGIGGGGMQLSSSQLRNRKRRRNTNTKADHSFDSFAPEEKGIVEILANEPVGNLKD